MFKIEHIPPQYLTRYATVPMRLDVQSVFQVVPIDDGLGGLALKEEKLAKPYVKDYDADVGNAPPLWAGQFDLQNWGIFLGVADDRPVAGMAIACRMSGSDLCEGREDLAVLWDMRVHPNYKKRGLGTQVFQHGVLWAREQGCKQLKIETQNINVPACHFYAKQGCHLGSVHQYAYSATPQVQHEAMLLWYLDL